MRAYEYILGILGVAFIVLKLTGAIGWSWVWVLSPFWAPILIVLILIAIISMMGRNHMDVG